MRRVKFQTGGYYHIYNRGVDKRDIFMDEKDFIRFLRSMREFNNNSGYAQRDYEKRKWFEEEKEKKLNFGYPKLSFQELPKLVDITCYCLNQNHIHLILKQLDHGSIERFMHKLGIGYTKYFNQKYKRTGSLFESTYKAIHIRTDERLLYLSCYVNGNPEIHKITKAEDWLWSSYRDYLGLRAGTLCNKKVILSQFNNLREYKNLADVMIKELRQRKDDIKKYLLE